MRKAFRLVAMVLRARLIAWHGTSGAHRTRSSAARHECRPNSLQRIARVVGSVQALLRLIYPLFKLSNALEVSPRQSRSATDIAQPFPGERGAPFSERTLRARDRPFGGRDFLVDSPPVSIQRSQPSPDFGGQATFLQVQQHRCAALLGDKVSTSITVDSRAPGTGRDDR